VVLDAAESPLKLPVIAVIPARTASSRLPDKPLQLLAGEPLVCHVLRQVRECPEIDEVLVASDDLRVLDAVGDAGVLVDAECSCGTERVAHAVAGRDAGLVLNVQVDQPFVNPGALGALVDLLRQGADIATLVAAPFMGTSGRIVANPNAVKVVVDRHGNASNFSRGAVSERIHIGVYAFRRAALDAVAYLPRSARAHSEDLEQLTWLDAGWKIAAVHVPILTPSIDTPDDLAAAQERLQ
jgi:3-deoxy-manno-octulosonate cytidylyltransferase (CMP-KDO synthetase)